MATAKPSRTRAVAPGSRRSARATLVNKGKQGARMSARGLMSSKRTASFSSARDAGPGGAERKFTGAIGAPATGRPTRSIKPAAAPAPPTRKITGPTAPTRKVMGMMKRPAAMPGNGRREGAASPMAPRPRVLPAAQTSRAEGRRSPMALALPQLKRVAPRREVNPGGLGGRSAETGHQFGGMKLPQLKRVAPGGMKPPKR